MGPAFQSAKTAIKQRFPGLIPIYGRIYRRLILQPRLRRMSAEAIFEEIYKSRSWGGTESHSGRGSSLAETAAIRDALPQLVSELGIESMLDIPCGDGHWMSQVTMGLERYIGGDIVSDLLVHCRSRWPAGRTTDTEFVRLDLINDCLPHVDLVFSRECLVHFSFDDAFTAFENIKASRSKYLLTTTYPNRQNSEAATGEWRVINLEAKPFLFPPPLRLINERCIDPPGNSDKSMGLWRVSDIPDFRVRRTRTHKER